MGRKSKGDRALLGCRTSVRVAEAVRTEATKHNLSVSAYMATVLAQHLGMPEETPEEALSRPQREELPLTG